MYYTIYKTTNLIDEKYYLGKHQTNNINDKYLGSGKYLKRAIKLYGKESFIKEILFVFDNEIDMNQKEKEIISEEIVLLEITYNLGIGGEGGAHFKNKHHTNETKEKLKQIGENKKLSDITKERISLSLIGRPCSEKTKLKLSESAKNRSDEVKNSVSESLKKYHQNKKLKQQSGVEQLASSWGS